jgi:hypothetical protein
VDVTGEDAVTLQFPIHRVERFQADAGMPGAGTGRHRGTLAKDDHLGPGKLGRHRRTA